MPTCRHCRKTFELDADVREQGVCPYCRAEIDLSEASETPETMPGDWTTIARSTSVAEVGYLANVLDGRGIESRVEQHDSFSAVDGGWTSLFQLRVTSEEAVIAAEALQNRLARDASSLDDTLPENELPRHDVSDEANAPVFWRPLLLIVISGASLIFIGRHIQGLRGPAPNPGRSNQSELLRSLEQTEQPFISRPQPGNPQQHRLWYDPKRRAWHLDTDADGDGEYELGRVYH